MEPNENAAIAAFDTLYTNNHIQILKVLLPYFDCKGRKHLTVLIKFMELRYTLDYFSRHAAADAAAQESCREAVKQPDIIRIFEQIKNFCTPSERAMFDQLAGMKKSMEMYEEMMSMMQMFSQFMPEEAPSSEGQDPAPDPDSIPKDAASPGDANPLDMLKGMLSPEQQTMFEIFQSSFGNANEKTASHK